MRRKLALGGAAAFLLGVLFVGGAAASTTQREIVTLHETDPFADGPVFCGFPLDLRSDGSFEVTIYFDSSGGLTKLIGTPFGGPFTLTLINPATGKSATSQSTGFVGIQTYNPDGSLASEADTGVTFNFVLPGQGTVFHVSGRIVFTASGDVTFAAGPHPVITDAMCAYLAAP